MPFTLAAGQVYKDNQGRMFFIVAIEDDAALVKRADICAPSVEPVRIRLVELQTIAERDGWVYSGPATSGGVTRPEATRAVSTFVYGRLRIDWAA
jgi:hypothetical protein